MLPPLRLVPPVWGNKEKTPADGRGTPWPMTRLMRHAWSDSSRLCVVHDRRSVAAAGESIPPTFCVHSTDFWTATHIGSSVPCRPPTPRLEFAGVAMGYRVDSFLSSSERFSWRLASYGRFHSTDFSEARHANGPHPIGAVRQAERSDEFRFSVAFARVRAQDNRRVDACGCRSTPTDVGRGRRTSGSRDWTRRRPWPGSV
jgi:hypothetical protein